MDDFDQAYGEMLFRRQFPLPMPEAAPAGDKPARSKNPRTGKEYPTAGEAVKSIGEPATALADAMAGALKGTVAAALGVGGDIREIVDMVAAETATKVMGTRTMPTTEEVLKMLPDVVKGIDKERQHSAEYGEAMGQFMPLAVLPTVKAGVRAAKKAVGKTAKAAPKTTDEWAESVGEEIGGVSHLRPIVSSLAKVYAERGPRDGRALLDDMAANAPEFSNFSNEVATKGFVDKLDKELARRASQFKPSVIRYDSEGNRK